MRANDDYETWNASAQSSIEDSILAFWERLLGIRKSYDVLVSMVYLQPSPSLM